MLFVNSSILKLIRILILMLTVVSSQPTAVFAKSTDGNVDYKILGVIASTKDKEGVALVKDANTQKTFAIREGASFGKDCTLVAVNRNSVRLKIENREYIVKVGESSRYAASTSTTIASTLNYKGIERRGNTLRLSAALRDHIMKNDIGKILMQAAAVPYYENGTLIGFRLWEIDRNSIFDHAGFKNGDIITQIDDQPLNNVQHTIKLLTSLKSANSAKVGFKRNGATQNLKVVVQ